MSAPAPPSPPRQPKGIGPGLVLIPIALLLIAAGVTAYAYWSAVTPVNFPRQLASGLLTPTKLDEGFTDADGDLVADAPSADKQADPATLRFSTLDRDLDKARETWKEFFAHFKKVTGKDVELVDVPPSAKEVAERLKDGKLHVATLSTGAVPVGVNAGGFVPVAVMAKPDGTFEYQMEVLVPASSPVKGLSDLKGRTLSLTSLSSLSSFKAPIVTLWRDHKWLPGRDYQYLILRGQEDAIEEVVAGKAEAVAVANDLLARVVARDDIDAKKYRSVYKSPSYPPACFGHTHALKPELAAKVREAFLTFDWAGSGLQKAFAPANQTKFVAVTYKKDWESVRAIDDAIRELVGQTP